MADFQEVITAQAYISSSKRIIPQTAHNYNTQFNKTVISTTQRATLHYYTYNNNIIYLWKGQGGKASGEMKSITSTKYPYEPKMLIIIAALYNSCTTITFIPFCFSDDTNYTRISRASVHHHSSCCILLHILESVHTKFCLLYE